MMDRVETRPADVRCSGLSPLEPDMEACSAGSTKNLKHDDEELHPAGSKTEKRKMVKLKDDEKEPHAAGSKKKKALLTDRVEEAWDLLPDRVKDRVKEKKALLPMPPDRLKEHFPWMQKMLKVEEEPEETVCKFKTVTLKLTMSDLKHFEEYIPPPPYVPELSSCTHPMLIEAAERSQARHEARLERRRKAVQQLKDTGSAELEVEILDEEDDGFAEMEKIQASYNCARSDP